MTELKHTFCHICEPFCPLLAECDDEGEVRRLLPDTHHPSGGIACHKGLSFLDVHNDPDRLDHPLRRLNPRCEMPGEFEKVDWDTALGDLGGRLKALRDEYGPNSVAVYYGNPFGMSNPSIVPTIESFLATLGTQMVFSPNTQDVANKFVGAGLIYGSTGSLMIPDLENTDYFMCVGGNPRVSRWTIMTVPNDDLAVLKRIRNRGGKVVFVNPRKTESSTEETGPTLLIKPGTDVYFLAALLREIDIQSGFDDAAIAAHAKGVTELRAFVSLYPADRVAGITGISSAVIKETARELMAAKSAAVYMSTGVNQSRQGMLSFWLVEMINFLTGNLGKAGGSYKPAALVEYYPPAGIKTNVETSAGTFVLPDPVGYSVLPGALFSTLIKNGDIRAVIVLGGNPVLTVGGEESFREAFTKLDLLVTLDIYRSATGEFADYVLPSTDWLEHIDITLLGSGLQTFPYVQYTDVVVKPKAERRNAWWVLSAILRAMELPSPLDAEPNADDGYEVVAGLLKMRDLSIEQMRALPSNTAVIPQTPRDSVFQKCLQHPDKKIDCFPPVFQTSGLFERCSRIFDELSHEPPDVLKIISLRTPYMHNSWLANVAKFRRGKQAVNPLYMTESDAAARDLQDGDWVRVFNGNGSIEARMTIANDLQPGVVAISHGYGHARSFGMRTAQKKPGSNYNALMPIGAGDVEPLSYMSWITGVPVDVERLGAR